MARPLVALRERGVPGRRSLPRGRDRRRGLSRPAARTGVVDRHADAPELPAGLGRAVPTDWAYGFCPICGSWPALAEKRGLDGARHLRCGCCGGDWRTAWPRCPFCGEDDHEKLGSLVSPDRLERETIEVCDRCRGYVKTLTTLGEIRPEHVVLQDLPKGGLDIT